MYFLTEQAAAGGNTSMIFMLVGKIRCSYSSQYKSKNRPPAFGYKRYEVRKCKDYLFSSTGYTSVFTFP